MKLVRISNNCNELIIGDLHLFFSYETCIAARRGDVAMRIHNSWGPTTGRHFRECGAVKFPKMEIPEFEAAIKVLLLHEMKVGSQASQESSIG